jgi:hypothetical protein
MRTRVLRVGLLAALLPALAVAGPEAPAPPELLTVTAVLADRSVTLYPYTGNDYSLEPYDPVNLLFPDLDPRQIRQALLGLEGERDLPPGTPDTVPFKDCVWADAMGSEQVAWAENEGWVGGEVQLACIDPDEPLGDPFRVHLRLYRQGDVTLGAAHFEILIPVTPQHEVLSWDFARDFVMLDMERAGLTTERFVDLQPFGSFRYIRAPIYGYFQLVISALPLPDLLAFLGVLGLPPGLPSGPIVWIPTDGAAAVLNGDLPFDPIQEKIHTQVDAPFFVTVPRPFCSGGPSDFVQLQGSLSMSLDVHTNPSGKYERRHRISGTLYVSPILPDGSLGPAEPAAIWEDHRALLTDRYGQLWEKGSQELQGATPQSLQWRLDGGQRDRYREAETCGP